MTTLPPAVTEPGRCPEALLTPTVVGRAWFWGLSDTDWAYGADIRGAGAPLWRLLRRPAAAPLAKLVPLRGQLKAGSCRAAWQAGLGSGPRQCGAAEQQLRAEFGLNELRLGLGESEEVGGVTDLPPYGFELAILC